jgi:hypothetical protein
MQSDYTPAELLEISTAELTLEGLTPDPKSDDVLLAFAAGEIDSDDLIAITRAIASE